MKLVVELLALISIIMIVVQCNHAKMLEENTSSANTSESHNQGQNCMNCHKKGKGGEGWFTIAGTVYQSNGSVAPNVLVKLYTQAGGQGELRKTIAGDLLGNFFTTDILGFGKGLYPSVEFESNVIFMNSPISSGECNSCHGVSTEKILVN